MLVDVEKGPAQRSLSCRCNEPPIVQDSALPLRGLRGGELSLGFGESCLFSLWGHLRCLWHCRSLELCSAANLHMRFPCLHRKGPSFHPRQAAALWLPEIAEMGGARARVRQKCLLGREGTAPPNHNCKHVAAGSKCIYRAGTYIYIFKYIFCSQRLNLVFSPLATYN